MIQARKRAALAKKRAARARNGLTAPPRGAASSTSGMPKSTAVALYTGSTPTGTLTTQTLSKKRFKKIERNKKYIAKRNADLLLIDAQAQAEDSMMVDEEEKETKQQSQIESVKTALWSVIEDTASAGIAIESNGEGTTLGGPSFF